MLFQHKVSVYLIIFVLLFSYSELVAQNTSKSYSYSQNPFKKKVHNPVLISIGSGGMTYWGDLSDGYDPLFIRPSANVSLTYYLLPQLSSRLGVLSGSIYANDNVSKYLTHQARNLHFRTWIHEFSSVLIYEFFKNQKIASKFGYKIGKRFSPYIFGGGAIFHFNPKAKYLGKWIALQPLGTEGQYIKAGTALEPVESGYPDPYRLWAFSIPFGGGVKFNYNKLVTIGFEAGVRKTFTDYLDDVSTFFPDYTELQQTPNGTMAVALSDRGINSIVENISVPGAIRGNPDIEDWYFDFAFSISYHLNWKKAIGL